MDRSVENGEEMVRLNHVGEQTTYTQNDQSVGNRSYSRTFHRKMLWRQIFAAVTVNLLSLAYGISVGWAAPNTVLFQTDKSPIGIMSSDQISWIASILCIGGVAGTVIFGCIVDVWGRKMVMICMAIPQLVANILLIVGTNHYYIYCARFLFGIAAGGVFMMVPIFVSEISFERIRGALGSLFCMMNNSGIVLGYMISSWMDYYQMPYVAIGLTAAFLAIFVWFPESPDYLAHKGRAEEAKKSYAFYGNHRVTQTVEDPVTEKSIEVAKSLEEVSSQKITLNDFKDPAVRRGIILSVFLILFADTSGVFAITHFMTELFEAAKMHIDIYLATIVVGLIQIVGSIVSLMCIDRYGRRPLFIFSAAGTGSSLIIFGGYYFLLARPQFADVVASIQWLPLVSLCAFILMASCAVATLPFFIISELMPVKVRGFVVTMCFIVSWVFAFAILQFYHKMVDVLGIAGTMWVYGICSFVEIFFVYFYLPETKNLTFEEIQTKLRNFSV